MYSQFDGVKKKSQGVKYCGLQFSGTNNNVIELMHKIILGILLLHLNFVSVNILLMITQLHIPHIPPVTELLCKYSLEFCKSDCCLSQIYSGYTDL